MAKEPKKASKMLPSEEIENERREQPVKGSDRHSTNLLILQ